MCPLEWLVCHTLTSVSLFDCHIFSPSWLPIMQRVCMVISFTQVPMRKMPCWKAIGTHPICVALWAIMMDWPTSVFHWGGFYKGGVDRFNDIIQNEKLVSFFSFIANSFLFHNTQKKRRVVPFIGTPAARNMWWPTGPGTMVDMFSVQWSSLWCTTAVLLPPQDLTS